MTQIVKSVLLRFARAGISGAAATMVVIVPLNNGSWNDVGSWLSALGLAGLVGFISGIIQAADKYYRSFEK